MREIVFVCRICERTWDTLPEGAVQLTTRKRGGRGHVNTFRFPDNSIHIIVKQTVSSTEEQSDVI
jgi:hypothetical protein